MAGFAGTTAIGIRVGSGLTARYNRFWQNDDGNISGEVEQEGNIEADPQFVDRAGRNYRLEPDSDCLAVVEYDTAAKLESHW